MTFEEMLNSHATLSVESNAMHTKVNLTGDACKLVWMATRAIGSVFENLPDAQVVEALVIAAKEAIDREAADRMIQLNASGKEKRRMILIPCPALQLPFLKEKQRRF